LIIVPGGVSLFFSAALIVNNLMTLKSFFALASVALISSPISE